ncbi:hypothetical protein SCLCIDRAFT_141959 [Scleroderma citrinum Foug A]|uniref:Uncharacterized protein n=1 Tax=Scleroderma citrinum Foug A TaxID=1036808 RepID=A0A0C2YQS5_9AGAM|nr:hypothetical protein SCLCIDRAFT_141959 [Scleroderma citrinum Foug A]
MSHGTELYQPLNAGRCWISCRAAVIVDIATPPKGGLSLFNVYAALSRSRDRHSIRSLHDFDTRIFLAHHRAELLAEDDCLQELDEQTMES